MQTIPCTSSPENAYLEENWPNDPQSNASNLHHKKTHLRQSRTIPRWIWRPLARSLGIKLSPSDRPMIGLMFYMVLLIAGLVFVSAGGFIVFFDICSSKTKSTMFTESFSVVFGLFWLAMGLYSNKLAFTTLTTPSLLSCVRLHTKTILKINAGILISFLSVVQLTLQLIQSDHKYESNKFSSLGLPTWICPLTFTGLVIYSVLSAFWNIVVLVLILSIARTHTIMLRRFICELEVEGQAKDRVYRLRGEADGTFNVWDIGEATLFNPIIDWDSDAEGETTDGLLPESEVGLDNASELPEVSTFPQSAGRIGNDSDMNGPPFKSGVLRRFRSLLVSADQTPEAYATFNLSLEDLFNRYWLIEGRLSIVSRIFQRWVMSWLAFVCTWTLSYIIFWIKAKVSLIDVILFIIPIQLLSLLCSAYAEVNNEGLRVARSVYPDENRIGFIRFFINQPLQMSLFNMPVNYTTILSILIAIAITFISKIVMDVAKFNEA